MRRTIVNDLYRIVCNTEERKREFIKMFFSGDPNRFGLDLLSYRNYQLQHGRGQDITADDLRNATRDEELKQLLTELFVDYVTPNVTKTIRKYDISLDDILAEHRRDLQSSIGRILHILIEKKYKVA
ncbi:hypothetical protein [Thermoanaerobacterium thermosulfurigenes]|uniref:hypothetical protein n=1 Tax=Thermoanaerobacterium thermosulfurigenes TaxID=33950 RepID=UPI003EF93CC0